VHVPRSSLTTSPRMLPSFVKFMLIKSNKEKPGPKFVIALLSESEPKVRRFGYDQIIFAHLGRVSPAYLNYVCSIQVRKICNFHFSSSCLGQKKIRVGNLINKGQKYTWVSSQAISVLNQGFLLRAPVNCSNADGKNWLNKVFILIRACCFLKTKESFKITKKH